MNFWCPPFQKKVTGEFQKYNEEKKPETFCVTFLCEVQEQEKLIYGDKSQNDGYLKWGDSIINCRHELIF